MPPPTPSSPVLQAHPPKDISLDDIQNEEQRDKVRVLQECFPDAGIIYIRNALVTCHGNVAHTAALFIGDLPTEVVLRISKLKKLFPKATSNQAGEALISCNGNVEDAAKQLGEGLASQAAPTTQASQSPAIATSTTTNSVMNGMVKSFTISTKTHTTSVMKSKLAPTSILIDMTRGMENEIATNHFLKSDPSPSRSSVNNMEKGTAASPIKVKSLQEKIEKLVKLLPKASPIACKDILKACGGDIQKALDVMIKDPSTQMFRRARGSITRGAKSAAGNATPAAEKIEAKEQNSQRGQQQQNGTPVKEESTEAKADRLLELLPEASLVACENALQACDGDMEDAFNLLEIELATENSPRGVPNSSTARNTSSKQTATRVTPPITPPARKVGTNQPSSSQGIKEDELTEFFANKMIPSPVIEDYNKEKRDASVEEIVFDDITMEHAPSENVAVSNDMTEEEVADSKVERLYESLLRKVPRNSCRVALKVSDGKEEEAFEILMAEHVVFDEDQPGAYRTSSHDGGIAGLRECREARLPAPKAKSAIGYFKRGAESPVQRMFKRARVLDDNYDNNYDVDADDEVVDEDEDEKENREVSLAPAAQWVKKTYPESTDVIVLLGPDRVPYDNVPCKVLHENFQNLKLYIEAALSRKSGPSKIELKVPDVIPETFDLLLQWVICDNIELESGPNEERITSILTLIAAAIKLGIPSLGSLTTRMESKLRATLSRDRLALKSNHIRAAYDLRKDGEDIQELFILASVRLFLQCKDDASAGPFKDDEDENMTAAQQAAYSGSGFVFHREMKRYPQFKEQLWDRAHICLKSRENEMRRSKRRDNPEVCVAVYTDPLNGQRFEL